MTKNRRDLGMVLDESQRVLGWQAREYVLAVFDEQLQVDFKNGLEKAHVGALVQTNLVFPDVDNEDFAGREREESTLALEVLILSAFPSVCTLDIHNQDVLGHAGAALVSLVLAHPYSLCGLTAFLLGHDTELCAEEVVEQGRLARRLRSEDGNQVVVEASGDDLLDVEVCGDVGTALHGHVSSLRCTDAQQRRTHLKTLSSSMTWTPFS
jgi:hypothetical protein